MTWPKTLRFREVARGPQTLRLEPPAEARAQIARSLGLEGLPELSAELAVRPWLDGAEISGRLKAVVEQVCGVSGEPFEQALEGEIAVRVVPAGSAAAPADSPGGEVALDLEAEDPPDVAEGEEIDLSAYVIEHLALEIDPFPRKPGAVFDYAPEDPEDSPFAALRRLKDREG
ncbi:MAG: YceD family protein [Phenylobacterium sp.]|uniref:YceD family protein n=1 Tax=Phenylobacterium sp. TaxID=1871053 RepID=UPI00391A8886